MAQQLILPINEHKLLVGTGSTALDQYAKVNGKDMKQLSSQEKIQISGML